jgi:MFS family permease
MLVYAYDHGGATTAGIVAVVQLVPAAVFAPFAATLPDRHPPATVLIAGYLAQAAAMGAVAAGLYAHAPAPLVYTLAAVAASAVTITRPTQCALLPALAHRPEELTAANVVLGWIDSATVLIGPALAGVLLGVGGSGLTFAVMAAVVLGSALLATGIAGPAAAARRADEPPSSTRSEVAQGFRALGGHPESRLLVGLLGTQFIVIGALDVLLVVLALGVLDLGGSGAGYLNAAFGAGGVLGVAATAALIGRPRLVPPLLVGLAVWGLAFSGIGLERSTATAFVLLAVAGMGRSLFDVAGRTLLQRTAPPEVLGRVFGVLEGLSMAALAAGSLLASALVAIGGAELAFVATGALLPGLALVAGRRLFQIDDRADVPVVELALLRAVPITAALAGPELERLARGLEPVSVRAGDVIFDKGDVGDRFYVVADGRLEVLDGDRLVTELGRGDAFGEIALLRDVPRTASVRARTGATVFALERAEFLAAIAGNAGFGRDTNQLAAGRLDHSARLAAVTPA